MTSNIHKLMSRSFLCGFFAQLGIHMFVQDWLGLEGYIAFAREHWWHISWVWGAAITIGAVLFYTRKRYQVADALREDTHDGSG